MHNMSGTELLFALLLVVVLALLAAVTALVLGLVRRSESEARDLADLRSRLAEGGLNQDARSAEIRERLGALRTQLDDRRQQEEEARQMLRRLEAVISGSQSRGAAGENILEEALHHLPPDMLQRDAWVGGKLVEFALRLPGGRILPLDSKWTASPALEALAAPALEPARRVQLAAQVEKEVERRVREVSQYIDPATTTPWALAAIPDAAYGVCRGAFAEAHRHHVVVVAYSMALPYVLALYQLHLQFARSVDMENLQASLMEVERQLEVWDSTLENKLRRAITMLENAYGEGKQAAARIRASAQSIQVSERLEAAPSLELVEPAEITR